MKSVTKAQQFIIGIILLCVMLLYMERDLLTRKTFITSFLQTNITMVYSIAPQPCSEVSKIYMVVLVGSHPNHRDLRDVIRKTWGNPQLKDFPFKLIFTFGKVLLCTRLFGTLEKRDICTNITLSSLSVFLIYPRLELGFCDSVELLRMGLRERRLKQCHKE